MAAWKDLERRVARLLGGVRIPCTGAATADVVVGDRLAVECKYRTRLPVWLNGALDQVEGCAGDGRLPIVVLFEISRPRNSPRNYGDGRLPIVVLLERGRRTGDSLVLMRLSAFEDWFASGTPDRNPLSETNYNGQQTLSGGIRHE